MEVLCKFYLWGQVVVYGLFDRKPFLHRVPVVESVTLMNIRYGFDILYALLISIFINLVLYLIGIEESDFVVRSVYIGFLCVAVKILLLIQLILTSKI